MRIVSHRDATLDDFERLTPEQARALFPGVEEVPRLYGAVFYAFKGDPGWWLAVTVSGHLCALCSTLNGNSCISVWWGQRWERVFVYDPALYTDGLTPLTI